MSANSGNQTREKLSKISDEVNELHPLLRSLFDKLPNIERVHYNHGPNEMGADFILYKNDETLMRTACIGVIVKAGTIKQNTSDVERQIEECSVPRKGADVSQQQIREIWVVTNGNITSNARDKLFTKYRDKKIDFIACDDLARLLDKHAPGEFSSTPPALQEFSENFRLTLNSQDQRSLIVPGIEPFYVEPKVIRREFDSFGRRRSGRPLKSLDQLLDIAKSSNFSVIQASPGGGKSRLSRELSRKILSSNDFCESKLLPISLHLDQIIKDPAKFLCSSVKDVRIQAGVPKSTRVVAFIDGFDELDLENEQRYNIVEELISYATENNVSVALLSRPFDEVTVLKERIHSVDIFEIEPLKGKKALDFLSRVAGQLDGRVRLVKDLQESLLMRALEGAPIAYMLLGRLIAENNNELPSNLTELFQKYCEIALGRWEIQKGLRSQKEYEVIWRSLMWLSNYMLDHRLTEISTVELETWLKDYCSRRSLEVTPHDIVTRLCHRNSILYLRKDRGVVGFRHRAFCEFFYAQGLCESKDVKLESSIFSPYWINSYFFFAGILRDCPELVETLSKMELRHDGERIMRVLNMGNMLLAGYMTPTEPCTSAIKDVALEAADLFAEACDPTSDSPLTALPTLQILGVLTGSFSNQYGYAHFHDALEEAMYCLENGAVNEHNAVALFMLYVAYQGSGGTLRFDKLISRFGEGLPLPVKLGIGHEADRMQAASDAVKKMRRNVRRSFQGRKGSRDFLRKMYEVPVKTLESKL